MKNGWFLDSMGHKLVGFGLHLTHRCVLFSSFRIGGKKKRKERSFQLLQIVKVQVKWYFWPLWEIILSGAFGVE